MLIVEICLLLDPLLMGIEVIARKADDLYTSLFPFLSELGDFAKFGGADRSPEVEEALSVLRS